MTEQETFSSHTRDCKQCNAVVKHRQVMVQAPPWSPRWDEEAPVPCEAWGPPFEKYRLALALARRTALLRRRWMRLAQRRARRLDTAMARASAIGRGPWGLHVPCNACGAPLVDHDKDDLDLCAAVLGSVQILTDLRGEHRSAYGRYVRGDVQITMGKLAMWLDRWCALVSSR